MSFPAYPVYSDSGLQWLGQVPTSWPSIPFGMLFRRIKRTDHGDEELLSVYRDYGVIRKSDRDDNFNNASDDLSSYQLVEPGDLAMNKMKAWQGSLGVSDLRGIVSPAYFVFSPRKQYHQPFMHYLLRSPPYAAGYMTISKGIRINQWDVDPDHLTSLPVLFPSIDEQQAIAAFLDRETAKIDALVSEQERLIALLKEKRQAVISHAVTKGLDPNAPMKDSGMEWLGDIPAHWDARPIRKLAKLESGHTPSRSRPEYWVEEECVIPWVTTGDVKKLRDGRTIYLHETAVEISAIGLANSSARMLPAMTVFLSRTASVGFSGIMSKEMAVSQDFAAWVCGKNLLPEYLLFCLRSMSAEFARLMMGSTHQTIYMPDIEQLKIPMPPLDEQRVIVDSILDGKESSEDLHDNCCRTVELLKERRAALISAAVTGKIYVRGLVAGDYVISIDTARKANALYTARGVVGAHAIVKLGKLGRMAVMKGGYLAEAHAGITELDGRYERAAAGPYCRAVITGMERDAGAQFGITTAESESDGGKVDYGLVGATPTSVEALRDLVGTERADRFLNLLDHLKDMNRKAVEAIATLYAAWNDLLAANSPASHDAIKEEVLTNWHREKADRFTAEDLDHWLGWMRRHHVVPNGTAPRTDHQIELI